MITFHSQKLHPALPFDEYLRLPGVSHSFVKYQQNGVVPYKEVTDKMKLGSLVDAILTEPSKVDQNDPQYRAAYRIAAHITQEYGDMIRFLLPQQSYSGVMAMNNMELEVCGRLDWLLPGHAVIDLKVTGAKDDKQFRTLIEYMGYQNQLFNYAGLAGVNRAYILPYSTVAKRCLSIVNVPVGGRNEFWEKAILMHGRAVV